MRFHKGDIYLSYTCDKTKSIVDICGCSCFKTANTHVQHYQQKLSKKLHCSNIAKHVKKWLERNPYENEPCFTTNKDMLNIFKLW